MKTAHSKIKTLAALTLVSAMGLTTTEAGAVIALAKANKGQQASPYDEAGFEQATALVDFNGPPPVARNGCSCNFSLVLS
ncbi:MAG: hypothetical protein ACREXS_08705 [Gammaproteobacteria bacterium]